MAGFCERGKSNLVQKGKFLVKEYVSIFSDIIRESVNF